jgi:hypothetical protein
MDDYESLSHTKWECKYHVVFIPKCRKTTLYAELRRHLGEVFRRGDTGVHQQARRGGQAILLSFCSAVHVIW